MAATAAGGGVGVGGAAAGVRAGGGAVPPLDAPLAPGGAGALWDALPGGGLGGHAAEEGAGGP